MRSIEELVNLINPGRKIKGKWVYIGVKVPDGSSFLIFVHELYFNDEGGFTGITESPASICGETIEEFCKCANMMKNDIRKLPIITQEEKELIFNS